jgi:hypothetical protein
MNSDDIFTQRARRWFIIVVEETFGFGSFHDLHYMTSWAEWQEVFLQFSKLLIMNDLRRRAPPGRLSYNVEGA